MKEKNTRNKRKRRRSWCSMAIVCSLIAGVLLGGNGSLAIPVRAEQEYLFTAEEALNLDNWMDVQNKQYVSAADDTLTIEASKNVQISPDFQTQGTAVYEYDFKIGSGSLGLQFNMKTTGVNNWDTSGYILNVSKNGHVDLYGSDETTKTLLGQGEINDYQTDDFNHVQVSYLEGGTIEVCFNNRAQALIAVNDTRQTYGYCGLVMMNANPSAEIRNFTVTGTRREEAEKQIVFADDFSGDLSQWKLLQNTPQIVDGRLSLDNTQTMQITPADTGIYLEGDAEYEFDIRSFASGAAGIQFNSSGRIASGSYDSSCYYINLRANQVQYCKDNTYQYVPIPSSVNTAEDVHVKVSYQQDQGLIQLYLNDILTLTWEDADYTGGYFGFISMSTKVSIDNVVVRGTLRDAGDMEFEQMIRRTSLIYKPLRDEREIRFPSVPEHYQIEILSTSPEGYIDESGRILNRPEQEEGEMDIDICFSLTDTENPENTITRTLPVPLAPEYQGPVITGEQAQAQRERFERQKYGLFVHYVAGLTRDTNGAPVHDIDVLAEDFDAGQFAEDVRDMGFEYVIFTVAHSQQRNLYPSKTMKRWRDDRREKPGIKTYTDDTDVIEELYQALQPHGIDLHLYLCELDGLYWSGEDRELTGWDDCGGEADGDHERYNQFQLEIADEMADRYAGKVKGFWFDGYFIHGPAGTTGPTHEVIDQDQYRSALMGYDEGLALVGNIGTNRQKAPYPEWTSLDYRCQELYNFADTYYNPEATADDARSWTLNEHQAAQVVTQGKNWWAQNKTYNLSVSQENLFLYVVGAASVSRYGGAALAMGCFPGTAAEQTNGNIWEGNTLQEFSEMYQKYLAPIEEAVKNTRAGQAYTTASNSWLGNEGWGVSTESPDGSCVYLHIIDPPEDSDTIVIPDTEDRSVLGGNAELLKYDGTRAAVEFDKTADGYAITLPPGEQWHELDTVIKTERIEPANPDTIIDVPGISDDWEIQGDWVKQDKIGNVMASRNDSRETREAGAEMSYSFSGDIVELYGNKAPGYGRMEVLIDGEVQGVIDCADTKTRRNILLFESRKLDGASHIITIRNLEQQQMAVYGLKIRCLPEAEREKVAGVSASPQPGTYSSGQSVTLASATAGAAIHYTTDGSEPDRNSHRYTEPLRVDSSVTIRAIAVKEGMENSDTAQFAYKIEKPMPPVPRKVSSVRLDQTAVTLIVGDKTTLKADVQPGDAANKSIIWRSEDQSTATVSAGGVIAAKRAGKVKISAAASDGSGKSASCTVTVYNKTRKLTVRANGYSLNKKQLTLQKGKSADIKAKVATKGARPGVTYRSSNKKIATVSAKGKVKARRTGTVRIMITSKDKKYRQNYTVKVVRKALNADKIKAKVSKVTLRKNKTYYLPAKLSISAKGKKTNLITSRYTYRSANKKVAVISKAGEITAKKKGKTTITVKNGKAVKKIKVVVR